MSAVIDHVIAAIGPASEAHGELARQRVGAMGPVAELAVRLAAAQHAVRLRVGRTALVVVAADHGFAAPGVDFAADHPTSIALREIASGAAAVAGLARAAGASVVTVDAGCAGSGLPATVVALGLAPTGDFSAGPAMTGDAVVVAIEAGIALAVALADDGMEVIGVGRIGLGGEDAAGALIERLGGRGTDALEALAAIGGGDTAVLVGLMLGAASMTIPVLLDGRETLAAAMIAARLAPAVTGSMIATQLGSSVALGALGLEPLVTAGIGRGEGAGAAMVMSLVAGAAALLAAPGG